jgi:tetratricopeptide (TPR) repeat protein
MTRIVPMLAFLLLVTISLLLYMFLARFGLGWLVITLLVVILSVMVGILRQQASLPQQKVFNRANRLYLSGDYSGAIALYRELVVTNPDQPQIYNMLATCYANLEQFEQALACYKVLTSLEPQNADTYSNMASVGAQLEPLDEAMVIDNLDKAWQLINRQSSRTANYFTLLKIAFTELEIERFEQAIRACDEAIRLQMVATTPRLVRGISLISAYPDKAEQVEKGRQDLMEFLRHGFDTEVSLKLEVQFVLKARELLLDTGGLPEDLRPKINNSES